MKIVIHWATDPILPPDIIDSSEWDRIPKKPEPRNPKGSDSPDGIKGWIHSISVMGRTVKGDHVAIVNNPPGHPAGSVKAVFWEDDPEERTPDEMVAKEFIFEPLKLRSVDVDMKLVSIQRQTIYCSDVMKTKMEASKELPMYNQGVLIPVKQFSQFVKPPEESIRHGIWESERNNAEQEKIETHGFREWV